MAAQCHVKAVVSGDNLDFGIPDIKLDQFNVDCHLFWDDMVQFWDAYRIWLSARGIKLYRFVLVNRIKTWAPAETTASAPLPHAQRLCDQQPDDYDRVYTPFRIAPAQDAAGRDVMLKLASKDSVEYRIYYDLLHCDMASADNFQGVLPPVAVLDTPYQFSFIVTPRWGHAGALHEFETVGDVIHYVRCLLKGLAFLHNRRIAHRDIDHQNILVNIYSLHRLFHKLKAEMKEHRRSANIAYCLFDFDRSLQLPLDAPLKTSRIAASGAMIAISPFHPLDVSFGEPEYNPFAFDVACLGNMFKLYFSHATPQLPMLAPLFDKMTTHMVAERFSASEALDFLEYAVKTLAETAFVRPVTLEVDWQCLQNSDIFWSTLPAEFYAKWGAYRTPPLAWGYYVLDHVAAHRIGWRLLTSARRILGI